MSLVWALVAWAAMASISVWLLLVLAATAVVLEANFMKSCRAKVSWQEFSSAWAASIMAQFIMRVELDMSVSRVAVPAVALACI